LDSLKCKSRNAEYWASSILVILVSVEKDFYIHNKYNHYIVNSGNITEPIRRSVITTRLRNVYVWSFIRTKNCIGILYSPPFYSWSEDICLGCSSKKYLSKPIKIII
jgi:hypothetical protein